MEDENIFHELNMECDRLFKSKGVDASIDYIKKYHKQYPKRVAASRDLFNYYHFIKHYNLAISFSKQSFEKANENLKLAKFRLNKINKNRLSIASLKLKIKRLSKRLHMIHGSISNHNEHAKNLIRKRDFGQAWAILKEHSDVESEELQLKIRNIIKSDLEQLINALKKQSNSNNNINKLRQFCLNLYPILKKEEIRIIINQINQLPRSNYFFSLFQADLKLPKYGLNMRSFASNVGDNMILIERPIFQMNANQINAQTGFTQFNIQEIKVNFDPGVEKNDFQKTMQKLDEYIELQIKKLKLDEQQ